MARLPSVGGDNGAWGSVLNNYLDVAHNADGTPIVGLLELGYTEFTNVVSITATTEGTANTIVTAPAITFDGATPVWVEAYVPAASITTAGQQMIFALYDGSSSIGRLGYFDETANGDYTPSVTLRRRLTPAAATKTYSLRAYVTGGTGFAAAGPGGSGVLVPGFILVRKPS